MARGKNCLSDRATFLILIWLIIGTGALFYFPPKSFATQRMREAIFAAVFASVLLLTIHTSVPMTAKKAVVEIGFPFGRGLLLPYRYGYCVLKFLPVFGSASLFIAILGPIAYVLIIRRDSK